MVPAERGLRRVIGDGESVPDGEVAGLDESDFLELYRQLVLMRTYDERSLVYHRQGRIGTYAIFWNHEAMQVGSHYALERGDWIFPSYRESAIGLLRGMPPATILSWWRGHPSGLVEPCRLQPRLDLRPDRDARAARGRPRLGEEAARRKDGRNRVLRRRRDVRGRVPRGRELRRRVPNPHDPLLQQQPVGDLDAAVRADRGADARRQGGRLRHSGVRAWTAPTCSRSTRRRARQSSARAPGDGPTFIEAITYRAAPHATADDPSVYIDP